MGRTWDADIEPTVHFELVGDDLWSQDHRGRSWRIIEERTGWRLSFRDPGDVAPTNAGVHRTRIAAEKEANRHSARPRV